MIFQRQHVRICASASGLKHLLVWLVQLLSERSTWLLLILRQPISESKPGFLTPNPWKRLRLNGALQLVVSYPQRENSVTPPAAGCWSRKKFTEQLRNMLDVIEPITVPTLDARISTVQGESWALNRGDVLAGSKMQNGTVTVWYTSTGCKYADWSV
jgi:hypothetical protein